MKRLLLMLMIAFVGGGTAFGAGVTFFNGQVPVGEISLDPAGLVGAAVALPAPAEAPEPTPEATLQPSPAPPLPPAPAPEAPPLTVSAPAPTPVRLPGSGALVRVEEPGATPEPDQGGSQKHVCETNNEDEDDGKSCKVKEK